MSERTYSQVNTGISVREASFVSPSQFEQLLASPSSEPRRLATRDTLCFRQPRDQGFSSP